MRTGRGLASDDRSGRCSRCPTSMPRYWLTRTARPSWPGCPLCFVPCTRPRRADQRPPASGGVGGDEHGDSLYRGTARLLVTRGASAPRPGACWLPPRILWARTGWGPRGQGSLIGSMVFAGREREISDLRGALGGGSRLVLVAGDAGIGKTRFVTEGLRGTLSVWGACLPLTEKLPFLPVAEALDALSRLEDGALLAGALAAIPAYAQAEAARLLPHLQPADAGPGTRPMGGQRERMFSGVAELLAAVARRSGLAVVIEDVHWADSCHPGLPDLPGPDGARGRGHRGGDRPQRRDAAGTGREPLAGLRAGQRARQGDPAGAADPRRDGRAGRRADRRPAVARGRGRAVRPRRGQPVLHRAAGRRGAGRRWPAQGPGEGRVAGCRPGWRNC